MSCQEHVTQVRIKAKRKKTDAGAGKVKASAEKPEWKLVELEPKEIEEDVDSDNGSFLDDDTEDFLPSGWIGNKKERKESKPMIGLKKQTQATLTKSTSMKSSPTKHHQTPKQDQSRQQQSPALKSLFLFSASRPLRRKTFKSRSIP